MMRLSRMERIFSSHIIALILLLGIAIRVIFVIYFPQYGNPEIMDSLSYDAIAVNILSGLGFTEDKIHPSVFVPPLYPFFLVVIYFLAGHSYLAVKLVQAVMGGLMAGLVYWISTKNFSRRIGIVAAFILVLHPELIALSTFLYTETLFIVLFCGFFFFLMKGFKESRVIWFVLSGLLLGLATLSRGTTLLFPFLLLFGFLVWFARKKALLYFLIFAISFVGTISPWTIRNYLQIKAFLPISIGSGDVFWAGNYLPFDGEFRYEKTQQKIDELTQDLTLIERDRKLMREAKKNILQNPVGSFKLFLKKIYRFWFRVYENVPKGEKREINILIKLALSIIHYLILILAGVGIYLTRKRWRELMPYYLLFFYFTLVHSIMLPIPRYRIPILPFLLMFMSVSLYKTFKSKSLRKNKMLAEAD